MSIVVTVAQQRIDNGLEDARFVTAEMVGGNEVKRGAGLWLVFVVPTRIGPAPTALDLFGGQTKEKEVLLAGSFGHLDGCTIARADGQGTVHHEFHVAGATGFITGGRDLLGDLTCRN